MQKRINIILFVVMFTVILIVFLRPNEKESTPVQPINYELFEHRFNEIQKRIDTLSSQIVTADSSINQIKFQIISDEKIIRNASNSDIDSIFNTMVSRQRKSSIH